MAAAAAKFIKKLFIFGPDHSKRQVKTNNYRNWRVRKEKTEEKTFA